MWFSLDYPAKQYFIDFHSPFPSSRLPVKIYREGGKMGREVYNMVIRVVWAV
jgi:hypothetical protein